MNVLRGIFKDIHVTRAKRMIKSIPEQSFHNIVRRVKRSVCFCKDITEPERPCFHCRHLDKAVNKGLEYINKNLVELEITEQIRELTKLANDWYVDPKRYSPKFSLCPSKSGSILTLN